MMEVRRRGWVVTLNDGTVLKEWECSWNEVPKKKIKELALLFEGRVWKFSDKEGYIQRKRGSVSPGETEPVIEARIIGYYDGNSKVEYVVDERTGSMHIRVSEV